MKTGLALIIFLVLIECGNVIISQNVNIPDANFKTYLIGNSSINTNADGEIQVSEAAAAMGTLDLSYNGIADLTGIEAFTSINVLNCTFNQLTSLDVSNNTALIILYCWENQLTSLNVSGDTALIELYCFNNYLTSLDVSTNSALTYLHASNNLIESLDVSTNTALTRLQCTDNQLTYLNVKNGKNAFMESIYFSVNNNPNLTCIQVDDILYSNANWVNKDVTANYSENCNLTNVADLNNYNEIKVYPNPFSTQTVFQADIFFHNTTLTIENYFGQTIKKIKDISGRTFTLDRDNIPSGLYFFRLTENNKTLAVDKLVITAN